MLICCQRRALISSVSAFRADVMVMSALARPHDDDQMCVSYIQYFVCVTCIDGLQIGPAGNRPKALRVQRAPGFVPLYE